MKAWDKIVVFMCGLITFLGLLAATLDEAKKVREHYEQLTAPKQVEKLPA